VPLCTASGPKAGVPANIGITQAFVASILPSGLQWLAPYVAYATGGIQIPVSTFCSVDPVPFPAPLTAADLLALLFGGEPQIAVTAAETVLAYVYYYAWFQLCQCTTGGTPSPTAPPSPPAGAPVINPPNVVTPAPITPCATFSGSYNATWVDGSFPVIGSGDATQPGALPLPAGVTSVSLTYSNVPGGVNDQIIATDLRFYNSAGAYIGPGGNNDQSPGVTTTKTYAITAGTVTWKVTTGRVTGAAPCSNTAKATVNWFCGSTAFQTQTPCCIPDANTAGLLAQILSQVNLIQRQQVPFAYVAGTSHPVSGNGSFAVQGLIGLKVTLTAISSAVGQSVGTPPDVFDAGEISMGTADGYIESHRIRHSAELWFPPAAGSYTTVGYTLTPGVTASITELSREP
jgi:hypothetical protein